MFDDAARYLKNEGKSQNYDVIICDSSDPVGPAEVLFEPEFFTSMRDALSPTGILCTQGECLWLHLDLIAKVNIQVNMLSYLYQPSFLNWYKSSTINIAVLLNSKLT